MLSLGHIIWTRVPMAWRRLWIWIPLLLLMVACSNEPALPAHLSENLLVTEVVHPPLQDNGVWAFGFDRRLEPKEDVRMNASLLNWLETRTGLTYRLHVTPHDGNVVDELCSGQIHFAIVGTVSYLQANHRCSAHILVRGLNAQGEDSYRAAIIVPPASSLSDIAGLRGHSFAFGAPNSTQGHLIPRLMLRQAGLSLTDLRTYTYTGSHAATANAVTSGRYDAGGLQDTLAHNLAARGLVRILALSYPYPSSGIVAGPRVPTKTVEIVQQALLTLDPVGADAGVLYHWERSEMPRGFTLAQDEDYEDLRHIAHDIGLLEP
ncbi:MAG TPA: phosphate/phosphite/phosphonate ABC transporter substrate-binding protein [Anaerolineae bacterium]|nr:phosphate/phosphite/phosphonate ABC transporter substrate-binding protein [Anaerolineae bacterium]